MSIIGIFVVQVMALNAADEVVFKDDFAGKLADGWSWVREDNSMWRVGERRLEIRVQPGNLWGGANNAKNVLVRPVPEIASGELEISMTVSNQPTHQYEQTNLAWYYDDSHMVKLGQELVNGKLSVVMGREEKDKTKTLGLKPLETSVVRLRLLVKGNQIRGQYMPAGTDQWLDAGAGELPVPPDGKPKISLHCYQGAADVEHWSKISDFRIVRIGN